MKRLLMLSLLLLSSFGRNAADAQAQDKEFPTVGTIERLDPRFDKLVAKDARIEKLAGDFKWTEGPVWIKDGKDGGYLLFSDIPNNAIHKFTPANAIATSKNALVSTLTRDFIKPSGYTGKTVRTGEKPGDEPGSNGLTVDSEGRLCLCEHGDRRVTRLEKDGKTRTVLADKYMGKRFNSPNDLVYHSSGELYFTDPPYGLAKNWDDPARELDFCGVYRIKKDGTVEAVIKDMSRPNGIMFSPDEKTLYVSNSDDKKPVLMAYPVKTDGSLGEGKVFFNAAKWTGKKPGSVDGIKVDTAGNLFAAAPGGIFVIAPDGTHLGTIATNDRTANCAWGEDGSVLYIAANHNLLRIRTTTKGKW